MDLKELGTEGVDWINLGQSKEKWKVLVKAVMNLAS